ncbi:Cytochrome P450 1A4 [Trichinella pseudospiralis]
MQRNRGVLYSTLVISEYNRADENDYVILFKGFARRLPLSRNELELKHYCYIVSRWMAIHDEKSVENIFNTKEIYLLHYTGEPYNRADENDYVILFKGLARRLPLSRNELELKHYCYIVSRWMAIHDEKSVENIFNTNEIYLLHYTGEPSCQSFVVRKNRTGAETLIPHRQLVRRQLSTKAALTSYPEKVKLGEQSR